MNSYIAMFEIPATDLARAVAFYQAVLGVDIECIELPGMEMGILPYEGQLVPAVIVKGEGSVPSSDGVTVYLNAGDDLQPMLDQVVACGGQVILEKTAHADNRGFFALFLDSEGNKLALNSLN
ncbi:MAG: VOC family protein [Saccharospirillaceae bacterium]|nr:VOC family protein [Saccharospirillaceae bacterium]MCD8531550.1 VOC family protein [Saccharospirillaceae bacterium]